MTAAAEAIVPMTCSNPDCRVADTGRCVEGLALTDCSHYGLLPDVMDAAMDGDTEDVQEASIRLPGAGTLTPTEASRVLRAGNARVVAVIGPSDAGKTSLIASLYDLLQEGPVSGLNYARSLTLHAFEQTCHDARAASRRGTPHVNRTPLGEVRFYHLEIGGGLLEERLSLLLGDRAGEDYRSAADDISTVDTFLEVRRADSLTVLIDGQRLLDNGKRHIVRSEIFLMLQALVDGGAVANGQRLAVVLTKQDVVQQSDYRQRAETGFQGILARIESSFGHVFSEIRAFPIAASPKTNEMARGAGVTDLLIFWLESSHPAPAATTEKPVFQRAYARLTVVDD